MKKLKLTSKQLLILKIVGLVVYVGLFIMLAVLRMSTKTEQGGTRELLFFDRVAFSVFGRNIYFYALAIMTGIFFAYLYGRRTAKLIGIDETLLFDALIYGVFFSIIGARLYYVAFAWNTGGFKENPLKVITGFFNEEGGLAIHGAIIAAVIFIYFYFKKRKEDIIKFGELLFPGFFIGQIIGRWGNFFNQEAHGGPIKDTVLASRQFLENLHLPRFIIDQMYIYENGYNYMHPTFLYELLWNSVGLAIVLIVRRLTKKYWYGDAILFYLVWYGIGRFFIEGLRTDYLPFNIFGLELRIAQVISVVMVLVGITLFILRRVYKYKPVSFLELIEENKGE